VNILVTNDDGIHSDGLLTLRARLLEVGPVMAVAPERPRSATGHSITLHKPLRIHQVRLPDGGVGYSTNGTPSDCVVLGMIELQPKPDLVVSGINFGPNLGEDLTYSGTVSAAMEATMFDMPALAISVASYEVADYAYAAEFAAKLVRIVAERGLPPNTFLNINVPDLPPDQIRGIAVTRQGRRRYEGRLEKRVDPRKQPYYWLSGDLLDEKAEPGTDVHAVAEGKISITPVQLDLTNHAFLPELRKWTF
jgi:5'-nucleotidase